MKVAALVVCALLVTGVLVLLFSPTRHLTQTPPQKEELVNGTNMLSFPVVQGRYLLRIGRPDMEPASFGFRVVGHIDTAAGLIKFDETYAPQPEVLSKQVSGGYISKVVESASRAGRVGVEIVASFPESESLTCTFQGIK
jgi:hypothetical protein